MHTGTINPATIATKPRVEMVIKVTITPTKMLPGPTMRLSTWRGWFVSAISCVQMDPFHVGALPLDARRPAGREANPKPEQMSMSDHWPRWRPLRRSAMRFAVICEARRRIWKGTVSTPSIVRQGSTRTMMRTENARDDIMTTRHLKPLWYMSSRNSASLRS